MKHAEEHKNLDVEGCFACRISGITFSADATPTRRGDTADKNVREKQLVKDMSAFKTSVQQGIKPTSLTGSAEVLARANIREDIP